MRNSSQSGTDAALNQPQEPSRKPQKNHSSINYSTRWWNLALLIIFGVGVASVIVALRQPDSLRGFTGNLVSSAWQLAAGSLIAWVVYKRFQTERFSKAISVSWDVPFKELRDLSFKLYEAAIGEPSDLRRALDSEIRRKLRETVARAERKGTLYVPFLDIEKIVEIDRACDAASTLATIDDQLPDPKFMSIAIRAILELYRTSSSLIGSSPPSNVTQQLYQAQRRWSAANFADLTERRVI